MGPVGNVLTIGVAAHDLLDDGNISYSNALNASLVGIAIAFPATAPFILVYGILDYTFDISGKIDSEFGTLNTGLHD